MKVGDKLICVDEFASEGKLINGRVYTYLGKSLFSDLYKVEDAQGRISQGWSEGRFKPYDGRYKGQYICELDLYDETPEIAAIRTSNNKRVKA